MLVLSTSEDKKCKPVDKILFEIHKEKIADTGNSRNRLDFSRLIMPGSSKSSVDGRAQNRIKNR